MNTERIDEANDIQIFDNQPEITEEDFLKLKDKGLIISKTFKYVNKNKNEYNVKNRFPHDVISYKPLSEAITANKINQEEARKLILLEITRQGGEPRASHFARLVVIAYSEEKNKAHSSILEACQQRAV